jgi:hypothetical protein
MRMEREYQSYLLRVWRVQRADGSGWQLRLVCVQNGQEWRFASLAALTAFLEAAPDERAAAEEPPALTGSEIQV